MRRLLPVLAFLLVAMFSYHDFIVQPHQIREHIYPSQMILDAPTGGDCVKDVGQFANGPRVEYVVCDHTQEGTIEWHWSMPENWMPSDGDLYFEFTTFHPTEYCEHDGADPGERILVENINSTMYWGVECQSRTNLADPQPDWDSWGSIVSHASSIAHICILDGSAPDWLEFPNKVRMSTGAAVTPTGNVDHVDPHIWCRATVDTVLSTWDDVWLINIDAIFNVNGLDQEAVVDNPPWP